LGDYYYESGGENEFQQETGPTRSSGISRSARFNRELDATKEKKKGRRLEEISLRR